ncbi:MAG: hypothetical protein AAFX50_17520, partial [Acidobacteriota bacterium]
YGRSLVAGSAAVVVVVDLDDGCRPRNQASAVVAQDTRQIVQEDPLGGVWPVPQVFGNPTDAFVGQDPVAVVAVVGAEDLRNDGVERDLARGILDQEFEVPGR